MNRIKFQILFFFIVFILQTAVAQHKPFLENLYDYIENPQMIGLNQEEGHVPLLPYSNLEKAVINNPEQSSGFLSLDGKWKFLYAVNPGGINSEFFKPGFDERGMSEITVPGNWQMQGYGEKIFRNVSQPFKADPPRIPRDYNPVGSYRKTFTVPPGFKDKQLFLHFEGASSAYFLWVNGLEAGYNQGANEPAEFDVTKLLKQGKNTVSVMVFQYSDGTYNEDQDMWRFAGIFRSVYLMATPKVHIRDYYVSTDMDEKYENATLKVEAEIQNYSEAPINNYQVKVILLDQNNQTVLSKLVSGKIKLRKGEKTTIRLDAPVKSPKKWSDEKPDLYHIGFELIDPSGKTTEVLADRIGFKKVEIKHQVLYVNGVAVKLNGVNSHMQHPDLGHTMDAETIRKDFYLMKQFNINCVRTCHYPPVKEYLKLADELGIYIVDETGDEAHATEFISNDSLWTKSYVERAEKMVLRDRSHPSVIFWSAGNESGSGFNICEVIAAGKRLDPSRPGWMYGGNDPDRPGSNPVKCEDIIGPRYATPFELKVFYGESPEEVDLRPSFMDEYLAATGNSLGGMDEYWDVIYQYPRCIGGAIWDWVSPGLREKDISTPDASGNNINVALMGKTELVAGKSGKAVQLTGTDTWVEFYRDPKLDISGKALTVSFWVKPREWNGNGTFLSKGFYQFGVEQINEKELEFYVGDRKKTSVNATLPDNWQANWHLVTGIYNGSQLQIYIDGRKKGETACKLAIENKPFPVNIGRNPEIEQQENPNHYSNTAFDQVAIFDKVVKVEDLLNPTEEIKKLALCWLDFDEQKSNREFFSMGVGGRTYGMIWPDRTVQPELWQVKKSAQPVAVKMLDEEKGEVEIWNRLHFTNTNELEATWQLQCEGVVVKDGVLENSVPALSKAKYKIPYLPFVQEAGKEYFLLVSFHQMKDKPWAKKGFEMAWDQMPLKIKPVQTVESVSGSPAPEIKETEEIIQVIGNNFAYSFSKKTGNLISVNYSGTELLKAGMNLNVWRAPIANDLDQWAAGQSGLNSRQPGMSLGPVNSWFAHGLDQMATKADRISRTKNSKEVNLVIESHTSNSDLSTSFENKFIYSIDGSGKMTLDHTVNPCGKMPEWLPRVGIQMVMNQSFNQVKWFGRGPFETYPDRKTGAKVGVYSGSVAEQYNPYLIPQENGNKTDVRWASLQNAQGTGVRISSSQLFNFSAQQVESDNLSRALYPFQLKPFDGVTLNVDYAMSGVGCTAISVLNKYRVMPSEHHFRLVIEPFKN
jgi:beta-galactosidase